MQIKLAEALLRRKELQAKVDQIKAIKDRDLFTNRVKRVSVSDSIDEVVASVALVRLADVTAEYDFYARALRLIDAAIQQANWTVQLDVGASTMADYTSSTAATE